MTIVQTQNPYLEVFNKYMVKVPNWPYWDARTRADLGDRDQYRRLGVDHLDGTMNVHNVRFLLTETMAFSVPTEEAIGAISDLHRDVVEMGAGTGYWAWMLQQAGVDVIAYDLHPDESNEYCCVDHWTLVRRGNTGMLARHSDRVLLLCWPPHASPMATNCLRHYCGDTLIYVGEDWGGCCANDRFFEQLERDWTLEKEVDLPQWLGVHDYLAIYRR